MSADNAGQRAVVEPRAYGPFGAMIQAYLSEAPGPNRLGFAPATLIEGAAGPLKGLARIQLEMTGLAMRRAQAYMQFTAELARCRTPRDLIDLEVDFWRTAAEQYTGSSQRVMETWGSLVPGAAALVAPISSAMGKLERDYIDFSGTEKADEGEERARGSGNARRVA